MNLEVLIEALQLHVVVGGVSTRATVKLSTPVSVESAGLNWQELAKLIPRAEKPKPDPMKLVTRAGSRQERLDEVTLKACFDLYTAGKNVTQIAKTLHVSRATVRQRMGKYAPNFWNKKKKKGKK